MKYSCGPAVKFFDILRCLCTMWMKKFTNLSQVSLPESSDMAENRPLWRLMYTFGATHS